MNKRQMTLLRQELHDLADEWQGKRYLSPQKAAARIRDIAGKRKVHLTADERSGVRDSQDRIKDIAAKYRIDPSTVWRIKREQSDDAAKRTKNRASGPDKEEG